MKMLTKRLTVFCALFYSIVTLSWGQYRVVDGQIFRDDERIHLIGVNWFGFDSELHLAHRIWSRDYKEMIQQMKDLGFNAVRILLGVPSKHT